MLHQISRLVRRNPRSTAAGVAGALLLALVVPGSATPAAALGWSPLVDEPASYDAQQVCRSTPMPGTKRLAYYLMNNYPATGSLGMIRGCRVGGTSEHKDGRAFDWAADVAKPRQKAAAYDFIRKALATDAAGNEHALARRMGIMYFIYNDTIWSSYRDFAPRPYLNSGCTTKAKCSRNLRHLNHVHISLGYAGAAAQTSWYRSRNVASLPVLYPGTNQLDPDNTAVTALTVAANGKVTSSPYALKAGVTYRFVVTGTVKFGGGGVGDANCVAGTPDWTPTDRLPIDILPRPLVSSLRLQDWGWGGGGGWGGGDQAGSDHEDSVSALPTLTTHGLTLAGGLRWGDECRADHTYEAWYTPTVNQKAMLKYVDVVPVDNAGTLTVYIARDDIVAKSLVRK